MFSVASLDYLQQIGSPAAAFPADGPKTLIPPSFRRLWRVRGIGVTEKDPRPNVADTTLHLQTQDALIGLYGLKIPVAFFVMAERGTVTINIGTWARSGLSAPAPEPARILSDRQASLKAALHGAFQVIDLKPSAVEFPLPSAAGVVLGIPTSKSRDPRDDSLPLDRVIRGLAGKSWGVLVLAEPVRETAVAQMRLGAVNELKNVQAEVAARRAPNPLADYYGQLLNITLTNLTYGLAMGAWRTAVYLMGYEDSYNRLAAVWQGIFSGDQSLPTPIRVLGDPAAPGLAQAWSVLDTPSRGAPGQFAYPVEYQSILTSEQLASYIHFPRFETSGYRVTAAPRFDTVPFEVPDEVPAIRLGDVVDQNGSSGASYALPLANLTKHAFVAGVTGAGKTTTIFHLLKAAALAGVPFLVVEPAKTEYRELLNDPEIGARILLFTPGNELVSPLRLNPFEVPSGTPIAVHIDLLRSVFSVSFGMWTPLPQVLEECLHLVYRDRGWDTTTNLNSRSSGDPDPAAFPTLSDLIEKLDEVIPRLGFDPEATGRIRGSLRTRLSGLRSGGRGRMLDVRRSLPMETLFDLPAVLELEGLGDDDDKAFVMGLLLIRLAEHRKELASTHPGGASLGLRHLLVLEEAHRLLTNVGAKGDQGEANPRAKAVESFSNLLAEVRSYGQGVIVADQVPTKLAPDVIKNTNLKVAHRIVDLSDRKVLGGAMAMTDAQELALAALSPGTAAVFSEGDDAPLLVRVPMVAKGGKPPDADVAMRMRESPTLATFQMCGAAHEECSDAVGGACLVAREVVEGRAFQRDFVRFVTTLVEGTTAIGRLWPGLEWHVNQLSTTYDRETVLRCVAARAAEWFAGRRGAQAGWSYEVTRGVATRLRTALFSHASASAGEDVRAFQVYFTSAHERHKPPFPGCESICSHAPLCLYRHAVEDAIASGEFTERWSASRPADVSNAAAAWQACSSAAESLVEWNYANMPAARRIGLCYGQIMLARNGSLVRERRDEILTALRLASGMVEDAVTNS